MITKRNVILTNYIEVENITSGVLYGKMLLVRIINKNNKIDAYFGFG